MRFDGTRCLRSRFLSRAFHISLRLALPVKPGFQAHSNERQLNRSAQEIVAIRGFGCGSEELTKDVLDRDSSPFDRNIDTHVWSLRKKVGNAQDGSERIPDATTRELRCVGLGQPWSETRGAPLRRMNSWSWKDED